MVITMLVANMGGRTMAAYQACENVEPASVQHHLDPDGSVTPSTSRALVHGVVLGAYGMEAEEVEEREIELHRALHSADQPNTFALVTGGARLMAQGGSALLSVYATRGLNVVPCDLRLLFQVFRL